jgi:hypothetical protein
MQQSQLREAPVHEDKRDEANVEVNYNPDSSDEGGEPALRVETPRGQALRNGQLPLEHPALRDSLSIEHLALSSEPTAALVQEPSSHHEKKNDGGEGTSADDTSRWRS